MQIVIRDDAGNVLLEHYLELRPNIQDAMDAFWAWHDKRRPPTVKNPDDKRFINECLLLSLAILNQKFWSNHTKN